MRRSADPRLAAGAAPLKLLRCAVYTRKSTEYGLEQDFNSLDNQREAGEAFVKSQAHEGWRLLPDFYDDGGVSGGTLERPALRRLLAEVEAGRVDVIVVYKVDRLTRSLADFAKLVELFDAHGVSFVSVTQSFNTTTSMGRLTLNVLLSFAQFEREVTGERIRDKVAASKRKGLWMGGPVPLGYRVLDRKLVPEPTEAETVRHIFTRYLALGSLTALIAELDAGGMVTKVSPRRDGSVRGGIRFGKGGLAALLKNRCYVGEVTHKGRHYPGEHSGLVEPALFEAVQAKLAALATRAGQPNRCCPALLRGLVFDERGNRMTPATANKKGARYRYYVSCVLAQGRKGEAGARARVPAPELEALVLRAVAKAAGAPRKSIERFLEPRTEDDAVDVGGAATAPANVPAVDSDEAAALIAAQVKRVVVAGAHVEIIRPVGLDGQRAEPVTIPFPPPPSRRRGVVHAPADGDVRPIRAETRARLVQAIADGRAWLAELVSGRTPDTRTIATREGYSEKHVRTTLNLAFLTPDIVEAAVAGTLPDGMGIVRLAEVDMDWAAQRAALIPRRGARAARA